MLPLIDIGSKITVDNTSYNDTKRYLLTAGNEYIKIIEIGAGFDSNFTSNGSFAAFLKGASITASNAVPGDISASNSFSIPFGSDSLIFLEPGESVEFKFKISTGSGTAQVMTTGVRMTREEYLNELRRLGVAT